MHASPPKRVAKQMMHIYSFMKSLSFQSSFMQAVTTLESFQFEVNGNKASMQGACTGTLLGHKNMFGP
jgi:hypothetical protein